jgi:hypothetical protein
MTMNDAFLNCNIWSVHSIHQPYMHENFYLVESVYYYNSLESGIIDFNPECIQIPQFTIYGVELLHGLDFEFINNHPAPILYRNKDNWEINLRLYEYFKLQSTNIQQN